MKNTTRTLTILAVSAAAMFLAACDQSKPPTVGEKLDAGIERTTQAAADVKQDMQSAAQDLKQEATQAGASVTDSAADLLITTKVKAALAGDSQLSALAITVETVNKVVTLTGPAPTQAASERASSLSKAVEGVVDVKNQLVVGSKS